MIWPFKRKSPPVFNGFAQGEDIVTLPCIVAGIGNNKLLVTVPGVIRVGDEGPVCYEITTVRSLSRLQIGQQLQIKLRLDPVSDCLLVVVEEA